MSRFFGLSVCLFTFVWSGCNPVRQTGSEAQSLDNFAAGATVRINSCRGAAGSSSPLAAAVSADESVPAADRAAVLDAARQALTAVPAAMQRELLDLGATIVVASDLERVCPAGALRTPLEKVAGERSVACYRYPEAAALAADAPKVPIFLEASPALIRHSLTRIVGFLYADLVARIAPTGGGARRLGEQSVGFVDRKVALADAFVRDLLGRGGMPPAVLSREFGADGLTKIQSNLAAGSADVFAGLDVRVLRFADLVFAEAFDSYYCDAAVTRPAMVAGFPATAKLFAPLAASIEQHAAGRASLALQDFGDDASTPTYPSFGGNTYGDVGGTNPETGRTSTYEGSSVDASSGAVRDFYTNTSNLDGAYGYTDRTMTDGDWGDYLGRIGGDNTTAGTPATVSPSEAVAGGAPSSGSSAPGTAAPSIPGD